MKVRILDHYKNTAGKAYTNVNARFRSYSYSELLLYELLPSDCTGIVT